MSMTSAAYISEHFEKEAAAVRKAVTWNLAQEALYQAACDAALVAGLPRPKSIERGGAEASGISTSSGTSSDTSSGTSGDKWVCRGLRRTVGS